MVSSKLVDGGDISDVRLSSVVPARVTGENKDRELGAMDLIMKLHYIKGVYFFKSEAIRGLTIFDLKKPMFLLLDLYYAAAGRIRRSPEGGRPFIKCNDGGVRIVEANCGKTIEEWIAMKEDAGCCVNDRLIYSQALGPDLGFSPLVFVQFTWFKCGGFSVGLSWAHVLGDAFSASAFINAWAQILAGQSPQKSLNFPINGKCKFPPTISEKPFSLRKVDPVGESWINASTCKMESHSFHFTAKQISNILSKSSEGSKLSPFDILSALVWKSLAKVRGESEPRIVTVLCSGNSRGGETEIAYNGQIVSIVEAESAVGNASLFELANLIAEKKVDERKLIEEFVERESEASDFIVYGANLTFVNLEGADLYGLELNSRKPVYVDYSVGGIGEEGVVLVIPGPENGEEELSGGGRILTVILPENQMSGLKNQLGKEWGLF